MKPALLFAGPSGSGKTSLIEKITEIDPEFEHIFMYMTRSIRDGEKCRETKSREELTKMYEQGEVLYLLEKHGVLFGPSVKSFHSILNRCKVPMIEMSIYDITVFKCVYTATSVVYVAPPSKDILGKRLLRDGRKGRYDAGLVEIDEYIASKFNSVIDLQIINNEDRLQESAISVINYFKRSAHKLHI